MKKHLFSFVAILCLFSGMAYAYDADGNANKKREIDGAPASVAYREYQLFRFAENGANGVQLSAGDVIVRDCVSDDGVSAGLAGTVGSIDAVFGVVVSSTVPTCDVTGTTAVTDFGRRNWGYAQVKGLTTKCNITGGPTIAGGSIRASETPRYATAATTTVLTAVSAGTQRVMGFAYNASAQGQSTADVEL